MKHLLRRKSGGLQGALAGLLCALLLLSGCQARKDPDPTQPPAPQPVETEAPVPAQTEAPTEVPTEPPAPSREEELLLAMSLEEKVGQLFLARCPETGAAEAAERYHLGGFVLFGQDFDGQTPDTVRQRIDDLQQAAKLPLLIAVDEEGGTVCRVSSHSAFRDSRFPSPRALYDAGGMELVLETEAEKCALLHGLGINVNLAPVCDVATAEDAFMYDRSLGQSPEITAEFAARMVAVMKDGQVGSVLKHFPGYGENADTHTGIAVDERPYDVFRNEDFLPFAAGIEAGCGAILVSHNIVTCMDDRTPASLSPEVHRILREELGFGGVIVTDDLSMQAITDAYGVGEAAVQAVQAGNNLLCSTDFATQYAAVLDAAVSGRIPQERIDEAVGRVLRWKLALGILA